MYICELLAIKIYQHEKSITIYCIMLFFTNYYGTKYTKHTFQHIFKQWNFLFILGVLGVLYFKESLNASFIYTYICVYILYRNTVSIVTREYLSNRHILSVCLTIKYNGKEFVEMHGLDEYDSQARWYYPAIMRTTTMDPLCEKYYSTSPYV